MVLWRHGLLWMLFKKGVILCWITFSLNFCWFIIHQCVFAFFSDYFIFASFQNWQWVVMCEVWTMISVKCQLSSIKNGMASGLNECQNRNAWINTVIVPSQVTKHLYI
jgi:hypothetical protein